MKYVGPDVSQKHRHSSVCWSFYISWQVKRKFGPRLHRRSMFNMGKILTYIGASQWAGASHVRPFQVPLSAAYSWLGTILTMRKTNLTEWDYYFKSSNHYLLCSSPPSLPLFSCITALVSWERKCFRAFVTNLAASTCSNLGFLRSVCAICRQNVIFASCSRREQTQICCSSDSDSLI